jgi:hypothetical protein
MKLGTWLKDNGHTHESFIKLANKNGSTFTIHALAKWCRGVRIPRKDEMEQIYKISKGKVTPNDFYNLQS